MQEVVELKNGVQKGQSEKDVSGICSDPYDHE